MPASTHLFYQNDAPLLRLAWHEPPAGSDVPEAVVQEIWRTQRLRSGSLRTTGGLPVRVLDPGEINTDGGPDFRNARVRIGEMMWFGDVEIHTTSRAWFDHGHHHDARYDRVVLHVVLQPDLWTGSLVRADGTPLPELVLAPHLDAPFRDRLVQFFTRPAGERPCAWGAARVPAEETREWLRACATSRLLRRALAYADEDTAPQRIYENAAAALGHRPNAAAMARLARRVALGDLCTLRSQRDREALLFGMAGVLPDAAEVERTITEDVETCTYVGDLRRRFEALRPLDARPLGAAEWQYARLRPANFPDLRIAQLAALVRPGGPVDPSRTVSYGDMLIAGATVAEFDALLEADPGDFWTLHYRLRRPSAFHPAAIGAETRRRLLINVVIPAALAQARPGTAVTALQRACDLYDSLPAEDDRLVRSFTLNAGKPITLLHTQGMHELDETYCRPQRCLSCAIGHALVQGTAATPPARPLLPDPSCSSASSTCTSSRST